MLRVKKRRAIMKLEVPDAGNGACTCADQLPIEYPFPVAPSTDARDPNYFVADIDICDGQRAFRESGVTYFSA